MKPVG